MLTCKLRLVALWFFAIALFAGDSLAQLDSLPVGDTIHLTKRCYLLSTLREYDFHYANHLTDGQVLPLLRRSPDSTVRTLVRRGRFTRTLGVSMTSLGLPVMTSGLLTPYRRQEVGGTLMLTGLGLVCGAVIPLAQSRLQLQRAVQAQNQFLRRRPTDYYAPVVSSSAEPTEPTLADTVAVRHRRLVGRFVYRSIPVIPAHQLQPLASRLGDGEVKMGLQYTRRVSSIGRFMGVLGASYLTASLLTYGILRANGNSTTLTTPLFWTSVAAVTFNYGLQIHAGRVQLRTVRLLNERLRSRYGTPGNGEHFPVR